MFSRDPPAPAGCSEPQDCGVVSEPTGLFLSLLRDLQDLCCCLWTHFLLLLKDMQ